MRFRLQLILEESEKDDVLLDSITFDKDFTRPENMGLATRRL